MVDLVTKRMVQTRLSMYEQIPIIGEYVRLTYIYNPGAAFGIHFGPYSRLIFFILTVVALAALAGMYWSTPLTDRTRVFAVLSISGGAIGNLLNRIISPSGVVDWIDIGLGTLRWPVFNFADIAITAGAILLGFSLWREEPAAPGNTASAERRKE